jgi:hypothetical protein
MTIMTDLPESIINTSLQNQNIYKDTLEETIDLILQRYIHLIDDYISLFLENIKINNEFYYKYLLNNGIKTVNNVFIFILMYTRNLTITNFFCEKSYYMYIEFVSQIDNQNHSFLQLTGKDASLFVYKKTIYDLDNTVRKDYICKEKNKLDIVNIFFSILLKIFNIDEKSEIDNLKEFKEVINKQKFIKINILTSIVNLFSIKTFYQESNLNYTKLVISFIDLFISHLIIYLKNEDDILDKIEIYLTPLINKLKKYKISDNTLKNINTYNIKDLITKTPKKFIDLLIESS